ncbi:putative iron-regulated membrane protein [Catalinimonas alkaloidigena]|uniref:PepSY-associated TM helix domain-containing protein n=1 Tax=Catalinimonas alkaloidigena TaxID=1075417 RepID=UPI0024075519|nr:PepSY-associated TM helix domain-containing protein [Catalinimonas alkaloidigena]MDF9797255.1 putative iron-regulated membrane protein [Catalinimonas alkaloidigena]
MTLKKLLARLHLIIGLGVGLLFFIIALSGAIYTWAPEIERIIYKQKIAARDTSFVPISALKSTLDQVFPEGDFRTAFYRNKSSTAEVLLYAPGTYYIAQMNPYSAELVHLQDMNQGWLNYIKFIHRNLMLGDIGREIVHWVTLLALPMLLTGLVLWWPSKRKVSKHLFKIKWNASPKRLNYDLHNVLGFYATWILIFSILTGIFWGFDAVKEILRAGTAENESVYEIPKSDINNSGGETDQFLVMDSLMQLYQSRFPNKNISVSNPHQEDEPIRVALIDPAMLVYNVDHHYHDRYSGKRITGHFEHGVYDQNSTFTTLNGLVYDIHFGNIFGFPGKMLVCLASLIAASLPVTGFIIWWNKKKKKINRQPV